MGRETSEQTNTSLGVGKNLKTLDKVGKALLLERYNVQDLTDEENQKKERHKKKKKIPPPPRRAAVWTLRKKHFSRKTWGREGHSEKVGVSNGTNPTGIGSDEKRSSKKARVKELLKKTVRPAIMGS